MATIKDSKESRTIFLMLTNQCNLRCSYCYEINKHKAEINIDTALKVIRQDIEKNRDIFKDFTIVFHGGEPFLAFEMMKTIAESLWAEYIDIPIVCTATTNGTLLTENQKMWLTNNRHRCVCILSLDGGRETHNRNRCNSYDNIDRAFFRKTWPKQPVKMTIVPDTLPNMYENILELYNEGFDVNPSMAGEVDWNKEKDVPIFASELNKLVDFYLENKLYYPCKMLDISPTLFSPQNIISHNRACGAGTNIIVYDVDGHPYPCHTFITDFNQIYKEQAIQPLFSKLQENKGLALSPLCQGCYAYPACSPCYGLNYSKRGSMGALDEYNCIFTKMRIAAAAKMYSLMLLSPDPRTFLPLKDKTDTELANMIAGIIALQEIDEQKL